MLKYVLYILMFAVMGAVIYTWGLKKSQNQQSSMVSRLYNKCEKTVCKELKKGPLQRNDIKNLLGGIKVGEVYSSQKLAVTEPEKFTDTFIQYLKDKGKIQEEVINGKKMYSSTEK